MAADSSFHWPADRKDIYKFPERVVLWDEDEAEDKQIKQVGASACGATAALNVLVSFTKQLKLAKIKKKKKHFIKFTLSSYKFIYFPVSERKSKQPKCRKKKK